MFNELSLENKYFYHNLISFFMFLVCIYAGIKGYLLRDSKIKDKITLFFISFCLFQEIMDYANRFFLDPIYTISIQRDLPFFQFCQISFYFSLICMFLMIGKKNSLKKNGYVQFLFDCSFLLGFSGAFQGIFTPDFFNINNMLGVICIELQHSLIILNLVWLIFAYGFTLKFKGVFLTYLFINIIAPFALLLNKFLGINSNGDKANYFYVNELPKVDNFFLNLVSEYPSPDYIFYIQPIFIVYFISLYVIFQFSGKMKSILK